ncbi:MAG: energy transducer TonB [Gammaproteobacteria bacterium]|nr:MAG: energy transducer TonB [Gammaproteobacteria bacterium]
MAYAISTPMLSRRALVFLCIVAIHVGFVWVLSKGLVPTIGEMIIGPAKVEMIEEVVEEDDKPPPPPPKIETAPPPFVPPPDIAIDLPVEAAKTTAITATTKKPVAKPPPPPPAVKRVPPRQNPRRALVEPAYPPQSKRLGEEGATVLRLHIDAEGKVTDAQVAQSSGFPRLDEAAVKHAMRSWRFLPGTEDGKPVAMWYEFRVVWKIEK